MDPGEDGVGDRMFSKLQFFVHLHLFQTFYSKEEKIAINNFICVIIPLQR
jgi:hypothetical protein